jgi:hypothetical protein
MTDDLIKNEYPPNYHLIERTFNLKGRKPVFAYKPHIYNPHGIELDEPLLTHELTHFIQQGEHPDLWWGKYLIDKDFRLSQEIEATQAQYKTFCELVGDRNKRAIYAHELAKECSSELYGNMVDQQKAIKLIKG